MPWYVSVVSTLLGGVIALLGIWLKLRLDRRAEEQRAHLICKSEFADLARHYDRNVERIRAMRYNLAEHALWPELLHLEKLRWPEDTFLFSPESIRNSDVRTVAEIYKMRLRIRNANLDTEAAIRVFKLADLKLFDRVLLFVEARHSRIERLALDAIGKKQWKRAGFSDEERVSFESNNDMLFFDRPLGLRQAPSTVEEPAIP